MKTRVLTRRPSQYTPFDRAEAGDVPAAPARRQPEQQEAHHGPDALNEQVYPQADTGHGYVLTEKARSSVIQPPPGIAEVIPANVGKNTQQDGQGEYKPMHFEHTSEVKRQVPGVVPVERGRQVHQERVTDPAMKSDGQQVRDGQVEKENAAKRMPKVLAPIHFDEIQEIWCHAANHQARGREPPGFVKGKRQDDGRM